MARATTRRRSTARVRPRAASAIMAPVRRAPGSGPGGLNTAAGWSGGARLTGIADRTPTPTAPETPAAGMLELVAPEAPAARMPEPAAPPTPAAPAAQLVRPETVVSDPSQPVAELAGEAADAAPAANAGPAEAAGSAAAADLIEEAAALEVEAPVAEGDAAAPPSETAGGEGGESEPTEAEPEPSPARAVAPAAAAVARRASGSARHQPAGNAAGNAVAASNRSEVTQRRAAQQAGVQGAAAAETGEVDTNSFEAALREAIRQAMPEPRSESEARDVMNHGAEQASAALGETMGQQQTQAVGNLPAAVDETAQPKPSAMDGGAEVDLAPEAVGAAPAAVSAAPVVPPPSTEAAIDTSENRERVGALEAENNITKDQLAKGSDPQFDAALGARDEAETHDREAPARLREDEAADRQSTQERAGSAIAGGLADFHGARTQRFGTVAGQQSTTKGLSEERKRQITADIEAIGAAVRADVTRVLQEMDDAVNDTFQTALDEAMAAYDAEFEDVKGGIGTAVGDFFSGTSSEERLEMAFAAGRRVYDRRISTAISAVARTVETKLQEARDRVAEGRTEIDRYMTEEVSDAERDFAEEASTAIASDFDALEGEIDDRRDALVERMVGMYRDGIERRSAREEQLREENKSFWQRVYDATVGIIKKVIEFKNMLLGILARAAAVVAAIIQDPIGFLKNLIAGIGAGLERFMGNIAQNLQQALMGWLFGALEGAGIRLPETFDLKGFLDIVLQVLGLTKENVRARAVKILGEETVAKIEAAVDFLRILFTEGPAGIWQMLLEKLGALKDTIIEEIKSWVITKIIEAGIKWIIGLLNPASAFVKACLMIYDIVVFFIERGQQIIAAVNAIINTLGAIVTGNISAMAQAVEGALNRILPVVISFLAALLGLGGISDKIRQFIEAVQEPVNKVIDWVINLGLGIARKIAGLFGGGDEKKGKEPPEAADPETQAKIDAGLIALRERNATVIEKGELTREEAEDVATATRREHPVFKSIEVARHGAKLSYAWKANPEDEEPAGEEEDGPVRIERIKADDEEAQKQIEEAANRSGSEFELAIGTHLIKGGLVPEMEEEFGVPVTIAMKTGRGKRGRTEYENPSTLSEIRLKWQRGHRSGRSLRRPEATAEVFGVGSLGRKERQAVIVVEITLVSDFGRTDKSGLNAVFSQHKVNQFFGTIGIFKEKYGNQIPIRYYFYSDKELAPETRQFIERTLEIYDMPNVTVVWRVAG